MHLENPTENNYNNMSYQRCNYIVCWMVAAAAAAAAVTPEPHLRCVCDNDGCGSAHLASFQSSVFLRSHFSGLVHSSVSAKNKTHELDSLVESSAISHSPFCVWSKRFSSLAFLSLDRAVTRFKPTLIKDETSCYLCVCCC